jgi:hypothetical protein
VNRSAPILVPLALLAAIALLGGAASPAAASRDFPEVADDGVGDDTLPANLNIISGWVGNETATQFSLFMKIASLSAPTDDSETIHYHYHFQVTGTDGSTSLYHAMVHHSSSGAWVWMVQRWIPSGGVGAWGDSHAAVGFADPSSGIVEVQVAKAWVIAPKIDIAKNTWTIEAFYIHADLVRNADGTIVTTDTAPSSGTMGSYAVSVGTPVASAPSNGSSLVLGAVAAVGIIAVALLFRHRPGAGPRG